MRVLLFIGLVLISFSACQGDKPVAQSVTQDSLIGYWELKEAYKAKQRTQLLSNTFFEFTSDGKVTSNLHPSEDPVTYTFSNKKIIVESPDAVSYKIVKLSADTLELNTKMRRIDFDLLLTKKKKNEN